MQAVILLLCYSFFLTNFCVVALKVLIKFRVQLKTTNAFNYAAIGLLLVVGQLCNCYFSLASFDSESLFLPINCLFFFVVSLCLCFLNLTLNRTTSERFPVVRHFFLQSRNFPWPYFLLYRVQKKVDCTIRCS